MNPFLVLLVNGSAYLIGLVLVAVGIVGQGLAGERTAGKWVGRLVLVGVALAVGSAPPQPLWAMGVWAAAALGGGLALERVRTHRDRIGIVAGVAVFSLALAAVEAPHRAMPVLRLAPGETVYVIGDSISAGLDDNAKTWPAFLEDLSGHPVVNLAEAGATVASAVAQADALPTSATCTILEIGGNDMLGGTRPAEFERDLENLVARVAKPGRKIAMFELPLPPLKGDYGRVQRDVAARHGVALIPKRVFAAVLSMPNGTNDGLHLSAAGHQAMAGQVQRMFQ